MWNASEINIKNNIQNLVSKEISLGRFVVSSKLCNPLDEVLVWKTQTGWVNTIFVICCDDCYHFSLLVRKLLVGHRWDIPILTPICKITKLLKKIHLQYSRVTLPTAATESTECQWLFLTYIYTYFVTNSNST